MNREHSLKYISTAVMFLLLSLFFSGCVSQLNHVGAFSQASADLAKNAAVVYEDVNEITIKRRIFNIAATSESPSDDTFDKLIDDANLAVRISLLRNVENYSQALGNLASADFRKDIDSASKDLYGALAGLQTTYTATTKRPLPISNDTFSIIATAVDAIGTAIAENKRREALKTIIIQADPSIQTSMKLVSGEMPILKDFFLANLDTIWTEKVKAYQKEVSKLTFDQRIERLQDIRKAQELTINGSKVFDDLSRASKKIADAHSALRGAVINNQFTTEKLVEEIKTVVELSKSIKDFHTKLLEDEKKVTT